MNKQELLNELLDDGFSSEILNAFDRIKREDFIPDGVKHFAYENEALPIGNGATISQPYTIAFMLDLLELDNLNINNKISSITDISEKSKLNKSIKSKRGSRNNINEIPKILEIGSGSGYVLALINEIVKDAKIYGVERIKELVESSKKILKNNKNINIINKNGYEGLKEKAPFDRILVSAAANEIPSSLVSQLGENGILVIPVMNSIFQIRKINGKVDKKEHPGFVFVPLVDDGEKY